MTNKPTWHKIEGGSFDKKGKSYDYVIEQDKNKPLDRGGARLRIVRSKPVVKEITTRYEPHVEISGDANAYVPSYFGYDMKSLFRWKYIIFFNLMMVVAFLMILGINVGDYIAAAVPDYTLSEGASRLIANILLATLGIFLFFIVMLPTNIRFYNRMRLYFKLKREGLNYEHTRGGA